MQLIRGPTEDLQRATGDGLPMAAAAPISGVDEEKKVNSLHVFHVLDPIYIN